MTSVKRNAATRRSLLAVLATLILGVPLLVSSSAHADPGPAWELVSVSLPTRFAPESDNNEILLVATNVGAGPATGSYQMVDQVPPGLTVSEVTIRFKDFTPPVPIPDPTCVVSPSQLVTCSGSGPVDPGFQIELHIILEVEPGAPTFLENQATITEGGAVDSHTTTSIEISPDPAPFGFLDSVQGFSSFALAEDGGALTGAGAHPERLITNLGFPSESPPGVTLGSAGHLKDAVADLPRGVIVNPRATPVLCTQVELSTGRCPPASQLGTATILSVIGLPDSGKVPLYNMVPPPGTASAFGFNAFGVGIFPFIIGSVRSDGDYGLTGGSLDNLASTLHPVFGVRVELWGDPSSPVHNRSRACGGSVGICPVEPQDTALLTMPVECSGEPTVTKARATSWEQPDVVHTASHQSTDLNGHPVEVDGCNQLDYEPSIEAKPTTNVADAPSGLEFELHQPQSTSRLARATALARDITLTLPDGLVVNPSSADGLGACTEAEANYHTTRPARCPDSAKLGEVETTTPLLDHPVKGALYLAKPYQNPLGSMIALYLAIEDPETGVVANLVGEVTPDPLTGRLSTTFKGNPQLPLEDIRVSLFKGPRASLRTPAACATYTSTAHITPWSTPETKDAHPSDSFAITTAPDGGSCPDAAASAPHAPSFTAGTAAPLAGAFSPFTLKLTRRDATQPIRAIEATLPPGLSGRLAGIAACSEAQIAAAQAREAPELGALERDDPSCPASSLLGSVDVGAGTDPILLHVSGRAYLAGPYKGAPLSLVVITPAIAGPFDLGAVVNRTALHLDPESAQISAVSDPLPEIIAGIPLDIRQIEIQMDRPNFTLNPTSCDPMAITALATSLFGQVAALTSPFQVGGCPALPFKPKLSLQLKGRTKRTSHPKLIANLTAKPGEANIARAQVKLPKAAFLDQGHIGTVCTRVQFAAKSCPARSVYGTVSATTPLLDYPLTGNVYLRSSTHNLPDLVADLNGPATQPIEIAIAGRTDSVGGALRNTFEAVPDAPVTKFHLELFGGKKGLIELSSGLCKNPKAQVQMEGQNGKTYDTSPVVRTSCPKKHKKKSKHHKRAGGHE